jgi:DNA-binding response OmpR family regulator
MPVKILMADGDLAILKMAEATVSALKWCDLTTLHDGREVAKHLQDERFDGLIIADRLPHVNGFELVQSLKHSPLNARIPIVMLTGEDDIATMRRGFRAGVTFFSVKPADRERLFRLLNAVRGAMEAERRRHHRLPYHTPVTCGLANGGRSRFVAESREISEGGMSVSPSGGLTAGQVLELEFLLPQDSRPVHIGKPKVRKKRLFVDQDAPVTGPQKVRASVRYVTPSGEAMGMDFLDLMPAQREVIRQYVSGTS